MNNQIRMNDDITFGKAPSTEEIEKLAQEGFKSIIDLNEKKALDFGQSRNAKKAKELGIEYTQIPITLENMDFETVDRFREEIRKAPFPVFIHSAHGNRAAALVLMHAGAETGFSGEEIILEGQRMGFNCEDADLERFIKQYITEHAKPRTGFNLASSL